MYERDITKELIELATGYPVVTVVGPRQSGKTTLVKHVFSKKPYVNLEELDIQTIARSDPRAFLNKYPDGAVIDEIQRVPDLLSYIQVIVDQKDQKGMFILTGSHQLELHQAISQSLAGRTALLQLLPLSISELESSKIQFTLNEILLKGGYPRIYKDHLDPGKAYRNYFQTYVERDVRQLLNVKDLVQFQRFVHICAGRIGQLLNLEGIGNDVGISSHTVKEWISILEASFIVIRLQPYFENFGKRSIKAPKLYFTDVGLASYLLGIENTEQLDRDPLRGHLVENLVILELMKARLNQGLDPELYFYRDSSGREIDLIAKLAGQLIPIEIKAAQTFHTDFLKNLHFFQELAKERFKKGFLIYTGPSGYNVGPFTLLNFKNAAEALNS